MTRNEYFRIFYSNLARIGTNDRDWNLIVWQMTEQQVGGQYTTYGSFRNAKYRYHLKK